MTLSPCQEQAAQNPRAETGKGVEINTFLKLQKAYIRNVHSFGHCNYSHAAFLLVLRSQILQGSSNLIESIGKGYRKNLRRTIAIAITKIYLEF